MRLWDLFMHGKYPKKAAEMMGYFDRIGSRRGKMSVALFLRRLSNKKKELHFVDFF